MIQWSGQSSPMWKTMDGTRVKSLDIRSQFCHLTKYVKNFTAHGSKVLGKGLCNLYHLSNSCFKFEEWRNNTWMYQRIFGDCYVVLRRHPISIKNLLNTTNFDFTLSSNERLKVAVLEYKKRTGIQSVEHRNNWTTIETMIFSRSCYTNQKYSQSRTPLN